MPHTILILEDEPTIRENLVAFLEDEGFDVIQAKNGELALELLQKHTPDLAIVDIRLPGMDGDQWMQQAAVIQPNLKRIVYTGVVDYKPSNEMKALGLSEEDVIYKPVQNMDDITAMINQKLAG